MFKVILLSVRLQYMASMACIHRHRVQLHLKLWRWEQKISQVLLSLLYWAFFQIILQIHNWVQICWVRHDMDNMVNLSVLLLKQLVNRLGSRDWGIVILKDSPFFRKQML